MSGCTCVLTELALVVVVRLAGCDGGACGSGRRTDRAKSGRRAGKHIAREPHQGTPADRADRTGGPSRAGGRANILHASPSGHPPMGFWGATEGGGGVMQHPLPFIFITRKQHNRHNGSILSFLLYKKQGKHGMQDVMLWSRGNPVLHNHPSWP